MRPTTAKESFEIRLALMVEREIRRRKIGRANTLRSVVSLIGRMSRPAVMTWVIRREGEKV